jgi:uncharacterized protein YjiS (DUF1127 family)
MNTLLYFPDRSPTPASAKRFPLASALRAMLSAWQRRRMVQAALHSLQELDSRTLRDLGLDRSELPSIAHHAGDPTRARARWSC